MLTTVTTRALLRQCHRLLLTAVLAAPALASAAVPEPGAETLQAFRRMQCSLEDGKPATYGWTGRVYSRVPGEPDRHLFTVTGMNIRACATVTDKDKGKGFRMVSREILLYLDPQTGEILETWENPWTGETVDVIQIENDPVNQRPMYATGRDGAPLKLAIEVTGDQWWMTSTIPLFYENALGGPFQDYIGGKYHATEMFNFFGDVADLSMNAGDSSAVRVGWERISDWLPWMKMRSRVGIMYFHTSGRKLDNFEQLPDIMKDFIDTKYPKYREPPPLDDDRPNETSWTYFKKVLSETND